MFKKTNSVKSVLMIALVAFTFTTVQPTVTHAQTVVIPECPSQDDFPKPGCFDPKEKKEKEDRKVKEKTKKKPKKS